MMVQMRDKGDLWRCSSTMGVWGYFSGKEGIFHVYRPDRSAQTLLPIIQESILPGSTISDMLSMYGGIQVLGFEEQKTTWDTSHFDR